MTVATILCGERDKHVFDMATLLARNGMHPSVLGEEGPRKLSLAERVRFFCHGAQYTFAVVDAQELGEHLPAVLDTLRERRRPALVLCCCPKICATISRLGPYIETCDPSNELGAAYVEVFINRNHAEAKRRPLIDS